MTCGSGLTSMPHLRGAPRGTAVAGAGARGGGEQRGQVTPLALADGLAGRVAARDGARAVVEPGAGAAGAAERRIGVDDLGCRVRRERGGPGLQEPFTFGRDDQVADA